VTGSGEPLARHTDYGHAVETYARNIAGALGVPDLVYQPVLVARGQATREVSDGLLVVDSDGLILEVKSRDKNIGLDDSDERAAAWCRSKADEAVRQGRGTRRTIAAQEIRSTSLRGYERLLPRRDDWPIVVVIDHPRNPKLELEAHPDVFYVSLEDWLELHVRIRSSAGLIEYVRRALETGLTPLLGDEQSRYRVLAEADLRWAGLAPGQFPFLPAEPLEGERAIHAALFDDLIPQVVRAEEHEDWKVDRYLAVVTALDRVPTLARLEIGKKMRTTFLEMVDRRATRSFFTLDRVSGDRAGFIYSYTEKDSPERRSAFAAEVGAYALLRHHHAVEAGYPSEATTLSVGCSTSPG
jgi:hypothetical protein